MYLLYYNITPSLPPCIAIIDLTKGATNERWGGMGGCDWPKHNYYAKTKLKIHVRWLRSITCPKIHLHVPLEMPCIFVVLMQNPMACSLSFALGFSILDEWES
jgi:hypothetical protein